MIGLPARGLSEGTVPSGFSRSTFPARLVRSWARARLSCVPDDDVELAVGAEHDPAAVVARGGREVPQDREAAAVGTDPQELVLRRPRHRAGHERPHPAVVGWLGCRARPSSPWSPVRRHVGDREERRARPGGGVEPPDAAREALAEEDAAAVRRRREGRGIGERGRARAAVRLPPGRSPARRRGRRPRARRPAPTGASA